MKKIILVTYFILIAIFSFGQKKYGIKIYQNTDIFKTQYYESRGRTLTKLNVVNFSRPSLAIDIHTKNSFTHEIELLIPEVSKSVENIQYPLNYEFRKDITTKGKASSYSIRYELNKTLTNESNRFSFSAGVGINPYYVRIEYIPIVETTFYMSTKLYGFAFNLTPRLKYKLSKRISVDLNIPLKIYDLRGQRNWIRNPLIPIGQQKNNDYRSIFFETAYTIRLGLMYKLN